MAHKTHFKHNFEKCNILSVRNLCYIFWFFEGFPKMEMGLKSLKNPTLIPCILDIARRGLRALRVLMVLKAWMPPAPSRDAVKLMSDT